MYDAAQKASTCKATNTANTRDAPLTTKTWHLAVKTRDSSHVCRELASVDLGDQCWPTATRMDYHMFMRPPDHDGTIESPTRRNVSKVVLTDRPKTSSGPSPMGRTNTCKMICLAKT